MLVEECRWGFEDCFMRVVQLQGDFLIGGCGEQSLWASGSGWSYTVYDWEKRVIANCCGYFL